MGDVQWKAHLLFKRRIAEVLIRISYFNTNLWMISATPSWLLSFSVI